MTDKPLILVDGSSYLFRAYHALPPLTTATGFPTGAMYGVVSMLRKLIQEVHPDEMAVIFDTKTKNHRHALYPDYKANRPEMDPDLAKQIEPLWDIIRAMGIPLFAFEGIEADDVIGTLAHWSLKQGRRVLISTGDKDFAQLVSPSLTLVNTMTDTVMDEQGVLQKFGVPPERIIDYLTLVGDTVDNIPGVEKVGPKTALKWLETYGSLDNIIKNAHHITGKVGEHLRTAIPNLALYKELVTIQCEHPLPVTLEKLHCEKPNIPALEKLYQTYEFKSWLKELDSLGAVQASSHATKCHYRILWTADELKTYLDKRPKDAFLSVDLETTSLDTWAAKVVGVALCYHAGEAVYVPVAHQFTELTQPTWEEISAVLRPVLSDAHIPKVGHNLKYDMSILKNWDIPLNGIVCDTMLASYVLNSTVTRHNLGSVSEYYLHRKGISYEDVTGKGVKQKCFSEVDVDTACEYAAEDADLALQLAHYLIEKLKKVPLQWSLLKNVEIPLSEVLSMMERTGVLIDKKALAEQSETLQKQCSALEESAFAVSGSMFNLNSPKQLQEILYDKMGLPVLEKTPTGQPSTSESVLQELALQYELPKIVLQYRSLSKLKSTYTDSLPQQINPITGRLHTSYHQAITSTGRLSSSDPNLQNIPVRTEEGRKIRAAFIASPGRVILSADYSQIELRIMAHFSKDPGLLKAFAHDQDIHASTASEIFQVPIESVTPDQRRHAKAVNFGLIYGMSAFGLAKQIEVSREVAQHYIDRYFEKYPGVKVFMEESRQKAQEKGYVETLLGRRLYVPDIKARNAVLRNAAMRAAINAPLQGTAADLIKMAMIELYPWLQKNSDKVLLIMQVHDELVFEVDATFVEHAKSYVTKVMDEALALDVPLKVGVGVGPNWDAAH